MKNKYSKLFSLIAFLTVLFAGCNNSTNFTYENTANIASSADCTLQVRLNESSARTAMPDVSAENFTSLGMYITSPTDNNYYKVCGPYESYEELKDAKIVLNKGTYDFYIFALCESLFYDAKERLTISNGENILKATLLLEFDLGNGAGKGNLDISVNYPTTNVQMITAGIYDLSHNKITDFETKELTLNNGNTKYSVTDIPVGNYITEFRFYSDTEKANLIGVYKEAACISQNLTSTSSIQIDSLSNTYSITYNNLGISGNFEKGTVIPVSYTRYSGFITLPVPVPVSENMVFGGWYSNADYTGNAVECFNAMDCKDKAFYAKWLLKKTVLYNANGGSFTIIQDGVSTQTTTYAQYAVSGAEYVIRTASDLSLSLKKDTKGFLGWTTDVNGFTAEYQDGSSFVVTDNVTLYAVFAAAAIKGADETDTDGDTLSDAYEIQNNLDPNSEDTDGDGWTDAQELELYDPKNNIFDPRIADLPSLKVELLEHPIISYTYTSTTGETKSENFNTSESISKGSTNSSTHGETSSNTHGWKFGSTQKFTFGRGKDGGSIGFQGWELGFSEEANGSYTNGSSYNYSTGQSENYSRTITNGKVLTETESRTITGGTLTALIKVTNTSNIAYTINSLNINLNRIAPGTSSTIIPVGPTTSSFPGKVTLEPEKSIDFSISKTFSNKETVETLMKNSNGIFLNVGGWTVTAGDGINQRKNDFTNAMTKVNAKCAKITIDYGVEHNSMSTEVYRVSAKTKYNTAATTLENQYSPITLHEMLNTIGLKTQDDLDKDKNTTDQPSLVLNSEGKIKSVRGVVSNENHTDGDWYIMITHRGVNSKEVTMYNDFENSSDTEVKRDGYLFKSIHSYNLDDIKIYPHDTVSIFYDRDEDGDGVCLSEENTMGTSDKNKDTDGDGLSDLDEIYGFTRGEIVYCTNPLIKDTDGDNIYDTDDLDDAKDEDPLTPAVITSPRLKTIEYTIGNTKTTKVFTDFKDITTSDDSNKYINRYTLDISTVKNGDKEIKQNIGEYFNIIAKAQYLGSTIAYSFSKDDTPGSETYVQFTNAPIVVPYSAGGKNDPKFVIRVTAPDGVHMGYYYITYISDYNELKGFSLSSPSSGTVRAVWQNYSDSRFDGNDNGGYIVLFDTVESEKTVHTPVTSLTKIMIEQGNGLLGNTTCQKIDEDALKRGSIEIICSTQSRYITFGLYGYEDCNADTIAFKCLATGTTKMTPPKTGTLKFFPHYIEAVEDHDDTSDPNYYWNFTSSNFKLDDLNVKGHSIHDFDDDCEKYYDLQTRTDGLKYKPDLDFSKPYTCTFERNTKKTCTVSWHAYEYDYTSSDDDLGKATLKMEYDPIKDEWNCDIDVSPYDSKSAPISFILSGFDENRVMSNLYLNDSDGEVCMWFSVQWCWD